MEERYGFSKYEYGFFTTNSIFSIVAVWLLHLPNVDSLALPRWTSPTYSREYVYWKRGEVMKKDSSSFDVDDEHKIYTFSQVFRDHGVEISLAAIGLLGVIPKETEHKAQMIFEGVTDGPYFKRAL